MDPTTPAIPPGTAEAISPAMYGVLGYIAMRFLEWAGKSGLPWLKEAMGMVSQRDKDVAAAAKEGPIMVLEEVKRQLAETKAQAIADKAESAKQLAEILAELKEDRKHRHDCEMKYAALEAEVTYLRKEMAELKGDQS